jgi:hypothetical protein
LTAWIERWKGDHLRWRRWLAEFSPAPPASGRFRWRDSLGFFVFFIVHGILLVVVVVVLILVIIIPSFRPRIRSVPLLCHLEQHRLYGAIF